MGNYLAQHSVRKTKVIDFLNKVSEFLEANNEDAQSIRKLAQDVEHNLFSIVLVGEFSSGKSTFLNALMHRRILPSFTSETTATVNFLKHVDEAPNGEAGIVYYNDGRTEVLPNLDLTTIENVVSTSSNKGEGVVAKNIRQVDLFLDSLFLKNGIQLVDSPGLNGIAEGHLEITREQIKSSHAAIFMFSAERPGSKSDFQHLQDLKSKSKNIFFVLNKIDVIKESEGSTPEQVIDGLKKSYKSKFPEETEIPKFWPVAGGAALVARDKSVKEYMGHEIVSDDKRREELERISRMADFEDRLLKYLTQGERTKAQLSEPVDKALNTLKEFRDKLDETKNALSSESKFEDLVKRREELENKIKELEEKQKKMTDPLRRGMHKAIREIKSSLGAKVEKVRENARSEMQGFTTGEEYRLYAEEIGRTINIKLGVIADDLNNDFYEKMDTLFSDHCEELYYDLATELDKSRDQQLVPSIKGEFKLEDVNYSVGLEDYNAKLQLLQEKVDKFEREIDKAEVDKVKAGRQENELENLKSAKQLLDEKIKSVRYDSLIAPVSRNRETVTKYRDREGIFGFINQMLNGKKAYESYEMVEDRTQHDYDIQERDRKIGDLERDIKDLQDKIEEKSTFQTKDEISEKINIAERNRRKAEKDIEKLQSELEKKLNENDSKAQVALKRQITEYVEERGENFKKVFIEYTKSGLEDHCTKVLSELVKRAVQDKVSEEKNKLDAIIKEIENGALDRKEKLEQIEERNKVIDELLVSGTDVYSEITSVEEDRVEQEVLS